MAPAVVDESAPPLLELTPPTAVIDNESTVPVAPDAPPMSDEGEGVEGALSDLP
jgi:hypothetical protein